MRGPQKLKSSTEILAEFIYQLKFEHIPSEVLAVAKNALLDTVGAGIYGTQTEAGQAIIEGVMEFARGNDASIWGTNKTLSPTGAALVNGTAAHARELDDFGGCGHSGAVIIPTVFALAESLQATGEAMIVAIVAGYEVAARILATAGGHGPHNDRGWHSTGTCGSFGAAAAAGVLMNLQPDQLTWALGLAGSYTGGLWAFINDGAMSKRFHPGKAAETGIIAGFLAKHGFTGPGEILEAQWGGFCTTYMLDDYDLSEATRDLGEDFRILQTGFKAYASCRGVHSSLDAISDIQERYDIRTEQIKKIFVRGTRHTQRQFAKKNITTMLDAQLSIPYGIAVLLLYGDAFIDQYTPERISDSNVIELMQRIEIVLDPNLSGRDPPGIEVELGDGHSYSSRVTIPKGASENPMSSEEIIAKFHKLAGPTIGLTQAKQFVDQVYSLENLSSAVGLSRLVTSH